MAFESKKKKGKKSLTLDHTDVPRLADHKRELEKNFGLHAALAEETASVQPSEAPEANLVIARQIYVNEARNLLDQTERMPFEERRFLERQLKRPEIGGIVAPGDSVRINSTHDEIKKDAEKRGEMFWSALKERGVLDGNLLRGLHGVELAKVEYESAKLGEARTFIANRRGELMGKAGDSEEVRSHIRAKTFQKFILEETLSLNRLHIGTRPEWERNMMRLVWKRYRTWNRSKKITAGLAAIIGSIGVLGKELGNSDVEAIAGKSLREELERLKVREQGFAGNFSMRDPDAALIKLKNIEKGYADLLRRNSMPKREAVFRGAETMTRGAAFAYGAPSTSGVFKTAGRSGMLVAEILKKESKPGQSATSLGDIRRMNVGEGPAGPVRRQIQVQLFKNPDRFKMRKEDLKDPEKIDRIVDAETAKALKANGYMDDNGKVLIGTSRPGALVILNGRGIISIRADKAFRAELPSFMSGSLGNELLPAASSSVAGSMIGGVPQHREQDVFDSAVHGDEVMPQEIRTLQALGYAWDNDVPNAWMKEYKTVIRHLTVQEFLNQFFLDGHPSTSPALGTTRMFVRTDGKAAVSRIITLADLKFAAELAKEILRNRSLKNRAVKEVVTHLV